MNIINIFLYIIILTSNLYMNYSYMRIISTLFIAVIPLCFFLYNRSTHSVKYNFIVISAFYCFILVSFIAALKNADTELFFGTVYWIFIFISFFLFLPSFIGKPIMEIVYKGTLYTHIPLIFIPLINGLPNSSYSGVFENPNSFGVACLTLLTPILSKFVSEMLAFLKDGEKIKRKSIFFYLFFIPIIFLLIMLSRSRTSFITAVIILLFVCLFLVRSFLKSNTRRQVLRTVHLFLFGSIIIFMLFFILPIGELFTETILAKFLLKSDNPLANRDLIWSQALSDARLFGNGRDYFINMNIGAHNTFISILGQYGWLAMVLFISLLFILLLFNFNYSLKNLNDNYRFMPFLLLITFVVLSMGEGMLFKSIMVNAFICSGIAVINYNRKSIKSLNQT